MKRPLGYSSVVEHMLRILKAPGLIPSTTKPNTREGQDLKFHTFKKIKSLDGLKIMEKGD